METVFWNSEECILVDFFWKRGKRSVHLAAFTRSADYVVCFIRNVRRRKLPALIERDYCTSDLADNSKELPGTVLPSTLQSGFDPSDYRLFGPLKYHLRYHHYETDEAVQEAVRSWL
jgi:hypothetical protein